MKGFKLVTLLGIRPDYIRMLKLIKLLDKGQDKHNYEHILVHSGQHYDPELYGTFLKEFDIREPDINLGVGADLKERGLSGPAALLSLLIERVADLVEKVKPDAVMYMGDNHTSLTSIMVSRLGVPIIHLEAGGRSFDWRLPEEKIRIVTDHLSDVLYCYLQRYKNILLTEGVDDFRIKVIGNIIVDSVRDYEAKADASKILAESGLKEKQFILVTLHREENIVTKEILENKLADILKFAKEKNLPILFPVMPRTVAMAEKYNLGHLLNDSQFIKTKPLGFFDFLKAEKTARLIVSDSGTVQEEALILGTPCVVARRSTERPETIWAGATILEGFEGENTLYNKMTEAWDMKADWNTSILNPEGGSPSERAYQDLISKIETGFFKTSRSFEALKNKEFVRRAYGL